MVYYIKGGSRFNEANPTVWVALNLASFPDSKYLDVDWKQIDHEGIIDSKDPFWLFGSTSGGATEAEFGLYNDYRIKITASGIFGWVGPEDDDFEPLGGGGATTLDGLDDVVIDAPANNEVVAWNTATSEWINQTPAEAGLATAGHGHGDLHSEAHNVASHSDTTGTGAELNTLTDGSETALHKHDDRYYTEGEVDGFLHSEGHNIVSHSDTGATGANLNTLVGGGDTDLHSHAGGGGDDLGDHTATEDLKMAGHDITGANKVYKAVWN